MDDNKKSDAAADVPSEGARLHANHRSRVFSRYAREGLSGFEPHQMLELLLFYAIPRKDTNPTAHRLLNQFKSLYDVLHADQGELLKVPGIGIYSASLLTLVRDIYQAAEAVHREQPVVGFSRSQCEAYLRPILRGLDHEQVHVLYFNDKNRMIRHTLAAEGIYDRTRVNLRRIAEEAIETHAAGLVLAHNHPSQEKTFSAEDVELTKNLYCSLYYLNITVCDHLIFAGDTVVSLAERGIIEDFKHKYFRSEQEKSNIHLPD